MNNVMNNHELIKETPLFQKFKIKYIWLPWHPLLAYVPSGYSKISGIFEKFTKFHPRQNYFQIFDLRVRFNPQVPDYKLQIYENIPLPWQQLS